MSDEPKAEIPENAPWYAKTAMQTAVNFGVPTLMLLAIFGFWLAREIGWAPNPVEERLAKIEAGMQQDAGHAIRHDTTMQEMVKVVQEQNRKWEEADKRRQVWCVLKATTDAEKKACLTAGDK